MMKVFLVMVLALMTCSCAQKVWTHATKSQQALCAYKSQCGLAATQSVPAGSVPPGMDETIRETC
jgi:hypothetical protein